MPRFYFHMDDGLPNPDSEAVVLADLATARVAALRFIGQSLSDKPADFWSRGEWRLTVSDADHIALFAVHVVASDAPSVHVSAVPDTTT